MNTQFTTRIFKEGRTYVAHALELDISSCGGTKGKALKNLKEAVRLFLEEAKNIGSLERILEVAGLIRTRYNTYASQPPIGSEVLRNVVRHFPKLTKHAEIFRDHVPQGVAYVASIGI